MVSPLCGFRPSRAGRAETLKVPRPETRTASPAARESRIAATTAFTAWPASLVFSSVAAATFSTNSDWFISDLQLHCYETPTLNGKRGAKSALAFAALGARRGAQKSVVSPVPSKSSSRFQLDHHSRMSVFSDKRKEILSENVRIQEGCVRIDFKVETAELSGEDRRTDSRCRDTKLGCHARPKPSFDDRELDSASS
jgi:hypothetical protein